MTAEFIAAQRTDHGVPHAVSCRVFEIPASTFYEHLNRPPSAAQRRRAALDAEVRKAFDQKWCGDFKQVPTVEGPVFLATVEDLYSRRMVGFATSEHYPTAELAKDAINTAVATRGGGVEGAIFHSDNRSQYTSKAFAAACARLGINRSTGRTGNALDNAPAESFFSTLTHELIDRRAWATKASARQEIPLWVHTWYNQQRLHSTIGMVPPIEYEQAHTPNPQNQTLHD